MHALFERVVLKSAVPLGMFVGSTLVAITFMGGVYAILPAYEADLFGERLAGFALDSPNVLTACRERAHARTIGDEKHERYVQPCGRSALTAPLALLYVLFIHITSNSPTVDSA